MEEPLFSFEWRGWASRPIVHSYMIGITRVLEVGPYRIYVRGRK